MGYETHFAGKHPDVIAEALQILRGSETTHEERRFAKARNETGRPASNARSPHRQYESHQPARAVLS